jgi:hypothetical protein
MGIKRLFADPVCANVLRTRKHPPDGQRPGGVSILGQRLTPPECGPWRLRVGQVFDRAV